MLVKPLNERRKPKPVAVVTGAGDRWLRIVTHDGEVEEARTRSACGGLLASYSAWVVYSAVKPTQLLHTTGATCWTGYQWRGALVRLKLDGGPTILPARRAVVDADEPAAALLDALAWLRLYGVVPGSLGAMAWRLWRATLERPVMLRGPARRDALYGGRQEAPLPGVYTDARCWDLGAAYPASMAAEPYPHRMIPVAPRGLTLDGTGIARAEVRIPRMDWCPLPVRVGKGAICWGWGDAEGWWTWRDLRAARDAGCDVTVREAWAGMGNVDLFGWWWEVVQEGRALPAGPAAVVKAITSSLWGQFVLEGDGGRWVRWRDDAGRRPITVAVERDKPLPHASVAYIGAETTARVRERLWREALSRPDVVYCDTDAVITGAGLGPQPGGNKPGRWGLRATMEQVDIRGPQVYRWRCPTCDHHAPWHHVVAGAPTPETAAAVFRRTSHRSNVASLAPGDVTLPAGPLDRFQRTKGSAA